MRKPLIGILAVLAAAYSAAAQEPISAPGPAKEISSQNVAAPFGDTSASQVSLLNADASANDTGSFALATPAVPAATPSASAFPADPAAKPKFVFGSRDDYRWQLGLGVEFFRFRSNLINASLVGTNTTITYYTNSWFALEGSLVTGFAPEIYEAEHVKYFAGNGGLRIGGRKNRFEPFAHGLVGGAHLQPQTAANSRWALTAQAGIGLDYRIYSRLALRIEGDWVYSKFFSQNQNNFQGVAGVVFHF